MTKPLTPNRRAIKTLMTIALVMRNQFGKLGPDLRWGYGDLTTLISIKPYADQHTETPYDLDSKKYSDEVVSKLDNDPT